MSATRIPVEKSTHVYPAPTESSFRAAPARVDKMPRVEAILPDKLLKLEPCEMLMGRAPGRGGPWVF